MAWWAWGMITWALLAGGGVVLFRMASARVDAAERPEDRRTTCATCRHDQLAHQHHGPGADCSQCPCPAFRRSG